MLDWKMQGRNVFVGRREELHTLWHLFIRAQQSCRQVVVFIPGETGSGKTALVNHFLQEVHQRNQDLIEVRGICSTDNSKNPLTPYVQVAEQLLRDQLISGDGKLLKSPRAQQVFKELKTVAPQWLDFVTLGLASPITATLESIYNLSTKSPRPGNEFDQENLFEQYRKLIHETIKPGKMLVFFLDDFQWIDATSMDLLRYLFQNLPDRPMMVLVTYRPSEVTGTSKEKVIHGASYSENWVCLSEQLGNLDVREYVDQRYPGNTFSEEFLRAVLTKTHGYPFFLNQVFVLLESTHQIEPVYDEQQHTVAWTLTTPSVQIPNTVWEAIQRRLDQVAPEMVKILEAASVEGEVFTAQIVANVLRQDELEVIESLEELIRRYHLVREEQEQSLGEGMVASTYRFDHKLIQEYLYNRQSQTLRRAYHRKIVAGLETLYRSHLEKAASRLVIHCDACFENSKASAYRVLAGQVAYAHYAWREALDWAHAIIAKLDQVEDSDQRYRDECDALVLWSRCAVRMAEYQEIIEQLKLRLPVFRQAGRKEEVVRLSIELEQTSYLYGAEDVQEVAEQAIRDALEFNNPLWIYDAKSIYSDILVDNLDYSKQGRDILLELMEMCRQRNDHVKLAEVLADLAWCMTDLGEYIQGVKYAREAVEIARQYFPDDKMRLAYSYRCAGLAERCVMGYAQSVDYYQKSLEIYRETGDELKVAWVEYDLACVYQDQKNTARAEGMFHECIQHARSLNEMAVEKWCYVSLADTLMDADRLDEAEELLRRAEEAMKLYNIINQDLIEFLQSSARLCGRQGKLDQAHANIEQALAHARDVEADVYLLELYRLQAHLFISQQKLDAADKSVREMLKIAAQINDFSWQMLAYERLGEIAVAGHETDKACFYFRKAQSYYQGNEYLPLAERIAKKIRDNEEIMNLEIEQQNGKIRRLNREYQAARLPITISRVHTDIFRLRYFTWCMQNGLCQDVCCSFGADIDVENVDRLRQHSLQLEPLVGVPANQWFLDEYKNDEEYSGSRYTRTSVVNGRCVFLNRQGRGCFIHSYCLQNGLDYHILKPAICSLFPVTFDYGLLQPSQEAGDGSLFCLKSGPTLYEGVRDEIAFYMGPELVAELDQLASQIALEAIGS